MAQKVLTWSNSQLNSQCSFHVPCLFFEFRSEFASGTRCDIYVASGFIMFFKERSEGDQSIIEDISIRSSPKHSC